ncbi:MAG: ABC transporter ATP-binding protein [Chloroflexi bacterium]|nr:ABC transporter ATP-binding protein [Chloroflexota bacterium]
MAARDVPGVLDVRDLRKAFRTVHGTVHAVDGVSFTVAAGEIFSLLGHSGCGKTTTLRMVAGLEQPDSGEIVLNSRSLIGTPTHKRDVGLVFQDLALFPHKTVFENVAFGLRMKGRPKDEIQRRAEAMLDLVELPMGKYGQRIPAMLSGGEKQRVALARTLIVEPSIILFDEPLASLDRRLRDRMTVELRQLQKRVGLPAIYVTHDQEVALMVSDRIAVMNQGHIEQLGTPLEIYRRPRTRFVADFIGDMNFLDGVVVEAVAARATIRVGEAMVPIEGNTLAPGERVAVGIRPEDVRLTRERTPMALFTGTLQGRYLGAGVFVNHVALSDGRLLQARDQASTQTSIEVGASVWINCEPTRLTVLKGAQL